MSERSHHRTLQQSHLIVATLARTVLTAEVFHNLLQDHEQRPLASLNRQKADLFTLELIYQHKDCPRSLLEIEGDVLELTVLEESRDRRHLTESQVWAEGIEESFIFSIAETIGVLIVLAVAAVAHHGER